MATRSYTCDTHLTSPRPIPKPKRTSAEMRLGLEVDNRVVVTDKYTKVFPDKKPHGVGVIIKFQDRYRWETNNSTAFIEFSCGCGIWLDTSWLKLSTE